MYAGSNPVGATERIGYLQNFFYLYSKFRDMKKLKCLIGLHDWTYSFEPGIERKCKSCPKHQKRTTFLSTKGHKESWKNK